MTTAEMESIKDERICLVSSLTRELANDTLEQNNAHQADHLIFIINPYMEKIIERTFM